MSEALPLALAFLGGGGLGAFFFGGLWWTVRRALSSRRPALWFLGSLSLRMSVALVGFWVASGGHWERLLACVLGFLAARLVVTQRTQAPEDLRPRPSQGACDAP